MGDLIGQIIWYVCVLGAAVLFWGIGVYAQKKKISIALDVERKLLFMTEDLR